MQFLYPQVLWALLALSIPIIIHLFHFRRFKKVYFTNVRFLKEIKEEKSTRRRLRNLMVLIARMLAMAFLILAFAQPFISKNNTAKTGKNNVSIFIDNSFSMMASSEDVPLIEKSRKKAEEIISAYSPSDEFQIISHEMKGSQLRWLSKDNTRSALDEIQLTPELSQLGNVLIKQKQSRPQEGNHIIYFLSDFQKSSSDFDFFVDSLSEINIVPLQAVKESNISIDSAWFESVVPALNQNNKLFFKISNHGKDDREDVRVSILYNGQLRPEGTLDIKAGQSTTDTINILVNTAGWQELELRVEDYPVQFDDKFFLSFNVKETIRVLAISDAEYQRYLDAVFGSMNNFELSKISPSSIRYDQFRDYDLIVLVDNPSFSSGLSSELDSYIREGGNVLVFPARDADITSYNNLLSKLNATTIQTWNPVKAEVYAINQEEFVFENVFENINRNLKLPLTEGNFQFAGSTRTTGEYLLRYRDGAPYLVKYARDKGHLYFCAAPLNRDFNDLVLNAEIFVPLLYKASYASSQSEKLFYIIGKDNSTTVPNQSGNDEIIYKISGMDEFIPSQSNMGKTINLGFNNMIDEAGFYKVMIDNEMTKNLAMNYNRLESDLEFFDIAELKERYTDKANIIENSLDTDMELLIKEKDKGITLWKWCLILALLCLAVETLLLRLWKI